MIFYSQWQANPSRLEGLDVILKRTRERRAKVKAGEPEKQSMLEQKAIARDILTAAARARKANEARAGKTKGH